MTAALSRLLTRWATSYLRARGFVVMRIDPANRFCIPGVCWLKLSTYVDKGVCLERS